MYKLFTSSDPTFEQAMMMGCEGIRDNRSSSPTESDTSGISSVSELSSISDLMVCTLNFSGYLQNCNFI